MKKIAIIRRNGLGDLICTLPLIMLCRQKFADSKIFLFLSKKNANLLPFFEKIDEIVILPDEGNKYFYLLKTALKYRREKFDLAISAKTSPMKLMNLFLFFLGAKVRSSYVSNKWHDRLINRPLAFDLALKQHQALKNLKLVSPELNSIPEEFFPKAFVAQSLKQKYPLPKEPHPIFLISASTTRFENKLSEKRYAYLLNVLYDIAPFSLWIVSEQKDLNRAKRICSLLNFSATVQNPRNFEEFMVWLDGADCYFVGDGGVAHICAALGKRGVVLFGNSSTPEEWAPLSPGCICLHHCEHVEKIDEKSILNSLKRCFIYE